MGIEKETVWLYKKDSKGRIRQWMAWWGEFGGEVMYGTKSGLVGGNIKESEARVEPTKTLTSEMKAQSKLDSSFADKQKSGYFDTEADALAYVPDKLMLLHRWDLYHNKMQYPCFVQPKLDGVCAGYMDKEGSPFFKSRENNVFEKLTDRAVAIENYLDSLQGTMRGHVDAHGEWYLHGAKVSEIVEAIKGENKEVFDKMRFHIFDYMGPHAEKQTYQERLKVGMDMYHWGREGDLFVPIRTLVAKDFNEVEQANENFIRQGFEGTVICLPAATYEYERRSYGKLKKKNLFSEEFKVVDTELETGPDGDMLLFKCETKDKLVFGVRPAWSHARRVKAYKIKDDYLGKLLTVEFRSTTAYGVPFHPVGQEIRDYE